MRAALVYVYGNARKHLARFGTRFSPTWVDEYSSGRWFRGWARPLPPPPDTPPVARPVTWLLSEGWLVRGGGPLRLDEAPASG